MHLRYSAWPKAELHLHLEGSVDSATMRTLAPDLTPEAIQELYRFTDFGGFLQCFKRVVERLQTPEDYALITRRLLERLELQSFVRASGGKGLHVVVPLSPGCDWELTKRFAHGFADALARSEPERFLSTATKRLRNKRIFVDYLRNGRGATAVASYSLRAREGAPVAMPLAWRELSALTRANAFTLRDVPARLKRRRKDPWDGIDQVRQNLSRWAQD